MKSHYNIHGLSFSVTSRDPLITGLITAELKPFRASKSAPGALEIRFKMLAPDTGKFYEKNLLKEHFIAERRMTHETLTQHYRRSLITSTTDLKKKKVEVLAVHDPKLFPDPACYFCVTQPLSPWLKQKGLFFMHAGCVAENGKGVVIVGNSGAGKSTLTLSALQGGFKFFGDEQPLFSLHQNQVLAHGFPRRVRLDRLPASLFAKLRPLMKSNKNERLVFQALDYWPKAQAQTPCRPEVLIFPRFAKNAKLRLKKIHPSAALARLMQDEHLVWYQDGPFKDISHRHLELLQRLAESSRAFEMDYGVRDILKMPSVFRQLLHG